MKKKFNILTIGCKTNQYESQAFSNQLQTLGLIPTKGRADICIVNACSVTNSADKRSIQAIKSLKKNNPKTKFFITGCIGQEVADEIDDNMKVIPNLQKQSLVAQIFPKRVVPKFRIKNFENHTRAFVKVQDGCNSFCTYCVIPYTRGRSRSRKKEDILSEISKLVDNGYKEIVLTGINLGEYNSDISFADLIHEISEIDDLKRIKLSSIDPQHITDDLIDILINSKKISKYLHLSLQSGSDKILKKMNRKYSTKLFLEKITTLTSLDPDFTFMTDVIVGFPNETTHDFENTCKFIEKAQFTKVHIFPYSQRPNTLAAKFTNLVDQVIINKRKKILADLAKEISFKKRQKFIGREMRVLFENIKDDYFVGATSNNLLVYVPKCKTISSNEILDVKLVKNMDGYILGEICK